MSNSTTRYLKSRLEMVEADHESLCEEHIRLRKQYEVLRLEMKSLTETCNNSLANVVDFMRVYNDKLEILACHCGVSVKAQAEKKNAKTETRGNCRIFCFARE